MNNGLPSATYVAPEVDPPAILAASQIPSVGPSVASTVGAVLTAVLTATVPRPRKAPVYRAKVDPSVTPVSIELWAKPAAKTSPRVIVPIRVVRRLPVPLPASVADVPSADVDRDAATTTAFHTVPPA